MPTGVELQLFNGASEAANLTGIQALWWDVTEPTDAFSPVGKSSVVTTDSDGAQTITVTNNWGTATDDPTLVPSGWSVTGSTTTEIHGVIRISCRVI